MNPKYPNHKFLENSSFVILSAVVEVTHWTAHVLNSDCITADTDTIAITIETHQYIV